MLAFGGGLCSLGNSSYTNVLIILILALLLVKILRIKKLSQKQMWLAIYIIKNLQLL